MALVAGVWNRFVASGWDSRTFAIVTTDTDRAACDGFVSGVSHDKDQEPVRAALIHEASKTFRAALWAQHYKKRKAEEPRSKPEPSLYEPQKRFGTPRVSVAPKENAGAAPKSPLPATGLYSPLSAPAPSR